MSPELIENLMHNISYLRKRHGLSQRRMAVMLGVGPGTIRRLERGIWTPTLPAAILLYAMYNFGVKPNDLLYRRLDEKDAPPAD